MQAQMPYFRETGSGTPVACLHSSASSSRQWRGLTERLADRFKVLAADLYGCGRSPAWLLDRPMYLDDELALLDPVFRAAGDRFHLVGHSYGGAIALKAALKDPARLISLVLYEPVLFSVLFENEPQGAAAREIIAVRDEAIRLIDERDLHGAAQHFVDYWSGDGTWAAIPETRRAGLAAAIEGLRPEWHAVCQEPMPLSALAQVTVPTLFLTGADSRAPARAVARLLTAVLPNVQVEEIDGAGHMAPVTHPELVNPAIEQFLKVAL
jgi:pimeloyl-ACP methyl ester carboxylesterase